MSFQFLVKGPAKKLDYVWIPSKDYDVLAQIVEIEKSNEESTAYCNIIGYRDGTLKHLRVPLEPGSEVLKAEDVFIKNTLGLGEIKNGAFIGHLNGYDNLKVFLDLNKLLTRHVAVLAKSGSGKSYTVACLIEEILEKEIPVLVIDPHGEYSSLKYKNDKDELKLKKFKIEAKGFSNSIQEYSPDIENNPKTKPLKLNAYNLNSAELVHLLPARLSNAQLGLLYSSLRNMKEKVDFDSLINELELEENNAKYTLINLIEFIQKLNLFSNSPTSLQELIQPGKCTIINLKGIQTELQEVVVYKLMKDLFEARKKSDIPPFFAIIEEAHNYIPERNFGEAKSSAILRQIASVDYSEPILIKKSDSVNLLRIGEFVDSLMVNSKVVHDKNGFETVKLKSIFHTPAFDKKLKIKYKRIKKIIRHKINEQLYELILEKGKKVRITSSHSIFVLKDNKIQDVATSSLKKGDYVLIPLTLPKNSGKLKSISFRNNQKHRSFKLPKKILLTSEFLTLLGYYVAEGGCNRTSIRFALNSNEEVYRKEIINCLKKAFGVTPYLYYSKKSSRVDIISHKTSLSELFSGLCGNNTLDSKTPHFIFSTSDRLKASFISGCFNGDGYLRVRKGNKGGENIEISYKTISQRLIKELSYLLLSMSIHSAIYEIKPKEKNRKLVYQLVVNGKYCEKLLRILKNNKHRKKIKKSLENKYRNTNLLEYKLPTGPFRLAYKYYRPIASDDSINERMCIRRERANRDDLSKFIKYLKKKSRIKPDEKVIDFLEMLCNSEVGFLKVKEIRRIISHSKYVYDLSIGESENFISGVGGVLLHNSEGRKFGLGLSIISQRPARIDKSVLSQTGTQIILKVTNPGDIKAIANSVEGLTSETEREIKNIPIGTAMITGVVDLPLFVDIRPRMTKHGGEAVNMIEAVVSKKDFLKEAKDFDKKGELLNVIQPRNSKKDIELMTEKKIKKIFTKLIPCLFVNFKDFNVLINLNNGELIKEIDTGKGDNFTPKMDLSPQQKKVFDAALTMNSFTSAEIFSKTGLQFSDVYDVVVSLVKKGYFVQEGNKYKLSKSFNLNLQEYACYVSPDFSRIDYDEKLEKIHNSEEILRFLENFSKAKSSKECFLVVYGVEYS